jgi:hypothetical protein
MLGAGIVAVENATGSITAGAVPLGVTKVAVGPPATVTPRRQM